MAGRYTLTRSAYAVLGVSKSASDDEIRKAYRSMARKTHPDVGGDAAQFAEVQQAWELIGTAAARAGYDAEQRYAAAAAGATTHTGYAAGPAAGEAVDFETFLRAAAAAAAQQQRAGGTGARPGYWAEFGPGTTWSFQARRPATAPQMVPVSWAAVATPALAFFMPLAGLVTGVVGLVQTRANRRSGRALAKWGLIASAITSLMWAMPTILRLFG